MNTLRNLLALAGLAAIAVIVILIVKLQPAIAAFSQFEDKSIDVYTEMFDKLVETGNMAEATIWKVPVKEGLTPEDVEETMKFVANEHNFKNVDDLMLYKEIEAMSGNPYRFVKIYMFCNGLIAAHMLDYSDAYSAFVPCRITMVEDKEGKLWLYSMNMDGMIYGGKPLPAELKKEAEEVKDIMLDIMHRGANGEF